MGYSHFLWPFFSQKSSSKPCCWNPSPKSDFLLQKTEVSLILHRDKRYLQNFKARGAMPDPLPFILTLYKDPNYLMKLSREHFLQPTIPQFMVLERELVHEKLSVFLILNCNGWLMLPNT